jgi:hypothetical protein
MKKPVMIVAGAGLAALAAGALAQPQAGEGKAVYWMTADTTSGMGAMVGGANGGRPSMGSVMGAMMGRGGNRDGYAHSLMLQLGSSGRATGEPSAEHLPPPGLQAGPSLPLVTPQSASAPPAPTAWPREMERPRGRILIYWGCGEHARPGQPVVIDFASMTAGKVPPAFAGSAARMMNPPSPARFATYGEWPNQRSRTSVPAGGSLVGDHVVRGNYSPEIHFAVSPNQDFLAPVRLTSNTAAPSGAVPLVWQPISGSRAWFATAMGAGANGDLVIWTSSETQAAPMMDHLSDGEISRLVQQRVLLPATADRCTVPTEVARAGQGSMMTLTAFGGEANFSNPARPARAAASWRPDWTVKLRTKSTYMGLLGMNMDEMMGRGGDERGQAGDAQQPKKKKKSLFEKGLGGLIPH